MIPLTEKQQQLLDYLRSCERSPTFIEMQDALGLTSKSSVHRLVSALEERGFVRRMPNLARAIELVGDPQLPNFTVPELAEAAKIHGLVLGRYYQPGPGERYFSEVVL